MAVWVSWSAECEWRHGTPGDTARRWRYGTFEHRPEMEETHTSKARRHRLFTEALRKVDRGGVGKRKKKKKNFFVAIFQKKRKITFKKAESKQTKKRERNSAKKRKIDIPGVFVCVGVWMSVCG